MILPSPIETSKVGFQIGVPIPPPRPPIHPNIQYGSTSPVPPKYFITPRPKETITYNFAPTRSPLDPNSMLLYPPPDIDVDQGARTPYHICVNMNCFTPSSHITTIRKSSSEGEFVGDFEIGPSHARISNTVCLRGHECSINEVLSSSSRLFHSNWTWKTVGEHDAPVTLYWDDNNGGSVITCFRSKERTLANLLAKFTPRNQMRKHGRPIQYPKLEVTPDGHDYFEDILFSALIIERMRTDPPVHLI
ncbi:uncharacterized protein EV420DRAFT_968546 [Desarmillaria tabescens]|uniref:DUF6593 domain-containing protein n=1 Tax=Armillaria tabescens TaxID=1929756 RepID=A0AA39NH81_ARMTA|nr:uncharacterized protein EV420DRAFT_968546 [Desarmillaria tabescens]KAK0465591.1 hypothetical protein EV420DRAFT_968546 [Desarmillaria tabescens]